MAKNLAIFRASRMGALLGTTASLVQSASLETNAGLGLTASFRAQLLEMDASCDGSN